MGAAELINRILADAESKATSIIYEGRRAAVEIEERAQEEAARIRDETATRARRDAELIVERSRSRSRLAMRQAELAARWRVIERVFAQAAQQVRRDPRYAQRLEELVERYKQTGAAVELEAENASGGLVVRRGRETTDLTVEQVLSQIREELVPGLSRQLFFTDT